MYRTNIELVFDESLKLAASRKFSRLFLKNARELNRFIRIKIKQESTKVYTGAIGLFCPCLVPV